MKAYKDYMDRIGVDEEQHKKLLDAVRAAEEAAASGSLPEADAPSPEQTKVRRFPLKKLGLIASAAAAVVIVISIGGGLNGGRKEDAVTHAAAPEMTIAPEAAQTTVITKQASDGREEGAFSYSYTSSMKSGEEQDTIVPAGDPESTVATDTKAPASAADATKRAETAAATTRYASDDQDFSFSIEELTLEGTLVIVCASADADEEIEPVFEQILPLMKEVPAPQAPASAEFIYKDVSYSYDSGTGFLYAEGKGCVLPDDLRSALNAILNKYAAVK